jgi:hypothetical protein
LSCSRIAPLNPPASSSLADDKHVGSLLLRSAARDCRRSELLARTLSHFHPVLTPAEWRTGRLAGAHFPAVAVSA